MGAFHHVVSELTFHQDLSGLLLRDTLDLLEYALWPIETQCCEPEISLASEVEIVKVAGALRVSNRFNGM